MSDHTTPDPEAAPSTGRRSAVGRRVSPTAVIAVLLPLLTVGALFLVQPYEVETPTRPAEQVAPSRVDLACPGGDGELALATSAQAQGDVSAYAPDDVDPTRVDVRPDTVTTYGDDRPVFVRGDGPVAAELFGARLRERGLSTAECVVPRPDYWLTGLGAGAEHSSVIELSNPDSGPAVADITVWGRTGLLDVPSLRGVTVPGGESQEIDLAQALPRRSELAVQVDVSRGRLAATVLDRVAELGDGPDTSGWLPASPEPTTEQLLLGLVGGEGTDTLALSNPGSDEARVELRIVTEDASFVPEGLADEVRVAPGTVELLTLTETLRQQVQDGALGLQVTSTQPVTATLRSIVDGDLVHAPAVTSTESATSALVPAGDARLVLARAGGAGVATVTAYDADGTRLSKERFELSDGSGGSLDLPQGTRLVRVTPARTSVATAVVVRDDGATVVPLRELVRYALIPDVRPGLPD